MSSQRSAPTFLSVFCIPEQLAGFGAKLSPSGPYGMTIQNADLAQLKQRLNPRDPTSVHD